MSHRWDCPDRWEAERRGERDYEWGHSRSSNPYDDYFHPENACDEAAAAWRDGYRRAEYREEERREEEAAMERAARHRAELQAEEDYYYEAAQREAEERRWYEEQIAEEQR